MQIAVNTEKKKMLHKNVYKYRYTEFCTVYSTKINILNVENDILFVYYKSQKISGRCTVVFLIIIE